MTSIKLNMRGVPASRARVTKNGTYTPDKYANYKKALQLYFSGFKKYDAPTQLEIDVAFHFIPSKGYKRTKYKVPNLDVDNALKGVLDAGNGILYDDDMQIVKATVSKAYSEVNCIIICLKPIKVQ